MSLFKPTPNLKLMTASPLKDWQSSRPLLLCACLLLLTACSTTPPAAVSAPLAVSPQPATASQPFLRIETGMHTAQIMRIAVDKQERFLVTASQDKTARVWDLKTGKLLQVLRPPLGEGDEGKLYAVAMSPEGKEVALGGFTGKNGSDDFRIYLFDRATGRLTRQISGLPTTIKHLVYSHDGNYLAVTLLEGIRVYEAVNLKEVARDNSYGDGSWWADFAPDGRLVSSSYDGFIRLYDAAFKLLKKSPAPGGKQPFAVRFSPDGKKIVVGFNDSSKLAVLSGDDLNFSYAPDTQGIDNGDLSKVAWSQDGNSLYAAGIYDDNGGVRPVFAWTQAGRGQRLRMPLANDTVMDLIPLQNQFVAYGAGDPAWGVIDSTGQKRLEKGSALNDFRGSLLSMNSSASFLAFKDNYQGKLSPFAFDLAQQTFSKQNQAVLSAPITQAKGLEITDWFNETNPKLNGKPLALKSYETSRALAISQDGQHFLLGADWTLRYYDKQGQQQWQTPTPEVAWAVNLSADGRFAVAAFGDGTIRWYSISDGQEKLAFFPHKNGKDWVVWTPEGFYNATPDGEKLIGYHLNQGNNKEGQFVSVEQLSDKFKKPVLIAQRLRGEEDGIKAALAEIGDVREILAKGGLPPRLQQIGEPRIEDNHFIITLKVIDQGGGIGKLKYNLNGIELSDSREVDNSEKGLTQVRLSIPLTQLENRIQFRVPNARGVDSQMLSFQAKAAHLTDKKASLYVFAVGVKDYQDSSLNLKFADNDARVISATLQKNSDKLFKETHIVTLTNQEATTQAISAKFAEFAQQVKPEDVFILYLAGHGKALNGVYHFFPHNAVYTSKKDFLAATLNQDKIRGFLSRIHSEKMIMMIDTCYAGDFAQATNLKDLTLAARGADDQMDTNMAITELNKATGRTILAANSSGQLAWEGDNGHGYFTAAVLEGLQGQAKTGNSKIITLPELITFVGKRLPEISNRNQKLITESNHLDTFSLISLE